MAFAPGRHRELCPDALARAAIGSPRLAAAQRGWRRWRELARSTGPFGFYRRRAGAPAWPRDCSPGSAPEAGDAVDEFLRPALDHEQRDIPLALSLSSRPSRAREVMIKRDMDARRDEVRVMTVHGAKGLEAPVVFLRRYLHRSGDKAATAGADFRSALGRCPVWSPSPDLDPADGRDGAQTDAGRHGRRSITAFSTWHDPRAKDRLVIAGFDDARKRPDRCWYGMGLGRNALEPYDQHDADEPIGAWSLRLQSIPFPAGPVAEAPAPGRGSRPPAWAHDGRPRRVAGRDAPIDPSSAAKAADAGDGGSGRPFAREARSIGRLSIAS